MTESLYIPTTQNRQEIYQTLCPQIEALLSAESDRIANLANFTAVLKEAFHFFWVGFYIVKEGELVLGPFQGSVACTRIAFERGVCGACYRQKATIIVPDVNQFEGHIACSSLSQSEIVLPIFKDGQVLMVLDIDSDKLNDFDEQDQAGLETLTRILEKYL